MLSNTFIGSEFVEICFRFLRGHVLSAVIQYHDQCFAPDNVAYGTTNQCLAPGNVAYGTTTSAFHLAMCHTVPRPGPFTWHYVMWYHDQCISHGNVSYGKTTSATQQYAIRNNNQSISMCYAVPRPMPFSWQCVMRYHNQCNLAMCHAVPQTVYFTWQYAIRYHDQSLSAGHMLCVTTNEEIITNFMTTLSMKMNLQFLKRPASSQQPISSYH